MQEKSIFMLKPEAMPYKQEIMGMVEKSGIPIKEWRHLKLDEGQLRLIYPDTTGERWSKTKEHLIDKEVLAAIVEGDDVVEKLYKVCGDNPKPVLCKTETIRNLFKDITSPDGIYSENIIHRPKNKKRSRRTFSTFLPSRKKIIYRSDLYIIF